MHVNIVDYQNWVRDRAFNHGGQELLVMTAGFGGETGEVLELIKKEARDGKDPRANDLMLHELGDQFFYFVKIAQRYGYTVEQIAGANVQKLLHRDTVKYGRAHPPSIIYMGPSETTVFPQEVYDQDAMEARSPTDAELRRMAGVGG